MATLACKDISNEMFFAAIRQDAANYTEAGSPRSTGCWWTVAEILGMPEKLVLAKARKLIRQGKITGCACGCRGDWKVVEEERDGNG